MSKLYPIIAGSTVLFLASMMWPGLIELSDIEFAERLLRDGILRTASYYLGPNGLGIGG